MSSFDIQPRDQDLDLQGQAQDGLHARARTVTSDEFGRRVFVRGVVEVSNYCRENCGYCGMRRDNRDLARFRVEPERLAELLVEARPAAITDLNIQTGEDPRAMDEVVLPLISLLRRHTSLGISVCLGTLDAGRYRALRDSGATIYIMKFEISDADRYKEFRAPGTLEERLRHIRMLAGDGWHVSSGFIAGLPGETEAHRLKNISLAVSLPLSGCSVSPFIPGAETSLSSAPPGDVELTLNCMAWLRILRPDWVIPAVSALNLSQPGLGYRRGLRAGANLVTMNLTPEAFRGDYLLYTRDRYVMTEERVLTAIAKEGLEPSPVSLAEHYAARPRVLPAAGPGLEADAGPGAGLTPGALPAPATGMG
ncbi:MAG: radical SAM protein [Limisphaerales bacterium]